MLTFTDVKVTGLSRRYLDIDWRIAPTNDDLQEWLFYVERSEAEAGPWTAIAGPLVDRYYIRDNTVPAISLNRILFYRIRAVNRLRAQEIISPVANREGYPDLIAAEIMSNEEVLFREFVGTLSWLFPVRTFGQRCPQCWDSVLMKTTNDLCPTCYGTGFSGGYHYPVEIWPQYDPIPAAESVQMHDHHQQVARSFRCASSPKISPFDIVISHKNERMRVLSISYATRLGVNLHQEVQTVLLQPGSIEDALVITEDMRTRSFAPVRNFTNPQDVSTPSGLSSDALDYLLNANGYRP